MRDPWGMWPLKRKSGENLWGGRGEGGLSDMRLLIRGPGGSLCWVKELGIPSDMRLPIRGNL